MTWLRAVGGPNLKSHVERFIQTPTFEGLKKSVIVAERHLNHDNREWRLHYNQERRHEARRHLPLAMTGPPREINTVQERNHWPFGARAAPVEPAVRWVPCHSRYCRADFSERQAAVSVAVEPEMTAMRGRPILRQHRSMSPWRADISSGLERHNAASTLAVGGNGNRLSNQPSFEARISGRSITAPERVTSDTLR